MTDKEQPDAPSHEEHEEDNDETIKVVRIKKAFSPGENAFLTDKQEDESRESLAILSTQLMPVAPQRPVPLSTSSGAINRTPTLLQRIWRLSPILFIAIILAPFIGGSVLEAAQLNQVRNSLYQVDTLSGNTRWQQTVTSPTQIAALDTQGSLLNITASQPTHQLVALDANGMARWKTLISHETFFLPNVPSQPGTIVVALGNVGTPRSATRSAQFIAPNSPHIGTQFIAPNSSVSINAMSYHPLSLYLFKRNTGKTIWQHSIVGTQQEQNGIILGGDTQFIYVALTPTKSTPNGMKPKIQLLAIAQATGTIVWRIDHTLNPNDLLSNPGKILAQPNHIFWQVAGAIYDIDTTTGKIHWNQFLQEGTTQTLLQEESQMVEVAGVVLVGRSDAYHALDLASGNELWVIPNPGVDPGIAQLAWGIAASGHTLLTYGNGQIQAFDATNQQQLWSLKGLNAIENLTISDDGTLVYTTVTESIEGEPTPTQSLVALDMKNGAVRWTFQPFEQTSYISLGINGIIYRHNVLLTIVCPSSAHKACSPSSSQHLYALNASTGTALWQYQGNNISDVHLSTDGSTVAFQSNSTTWQDLTARLRG